ncbi:hypothetical protein PSm6_00470 [Pseudomonas solani]|uniref:Uncharacterized protein n=1 Tax=Pseudomonas solani TaxID=2731552 RepID=A0ABM7L284_9PSED|nr:hypothetical protein [Pseudomonas solani]BCD83640.1 hypothetical protein PSm6_00470 [Pseudomonas solani]
MSDVNMEQMPDLGRFVDWVWNLKAERDQLQRNLDFTEQWYAVRFERLADLGKSAGCWDAMAAIIANGTADQYEPPTYAQQLVLANHRADVAERERDQFRAQVEEQLPRLIDENHKLRAELDAIRGQEPVGHQFQTRDGEWRGFTDHRHYVATVDDGTWPIRAIYALPTQQPDSVSVSELLDALQNIYSEVEGNIEPTVRDLVNQCGRNTPTDPNEIYEYCARIKAVIVEATRQAEEGE